MLLENYNKIIEAYTSSSPLTDITLYTGEKYTLKDSDVLYKSFALSPWLPAIQGIFRKVNDYDSAYINEKATINSPNLTDFFNNKDSASTSYDETILGSILILGNGTKPANISDYSLESPIINPDYICTKETMVGIDESSNPYTLTTLVITNKSTKTLSISELGLIVPVLPYQLWNARYRVKTSSNYALIERTCLDTPVSIQYNESTTIKYRITNEINLNNVGK